MPRPVRVSSLGRHAATGQARVLINGRHVYLGKYGSPEAEEKYRRLVAEWLAAGRMPASAAPAELRRADPGSKRTRRHRAGRCRRHLDDSVATEPNRDTD